MNVHFSHSSTQTLCPIMHIKTMLTVASMLTTAALTACGGGNENNNATFTTSTGATTATAASIASGKTLYTAGCQSCHGSSLPAAKNSSLTLSAIASNRGGMGYLSSSIQATEADEIAAYQAYGL
jgi:mono/diheme cytochrome c family protein